MKNLFVGLLLLAAAGMVAQSCSSFPGLSKKSDVAAQVGPKKITVREIDEAIRPELAKIESERYEARKAKLDQMIDDALIADKAKSLGITKEELIKQEVTEKAKVPTDADVKATFDKFKGQTGGAAFEALAPRIKDMLTTQATNARRAEYLGELKKEAKVTINITPPRFEVDTSAGHAEGPKNAPIVFVEFSDYQCPFCGRSQDAVGKVLEKYDGKVHHVFMDFPLTSIHPFAMPAAVASHCAEEQGKYDEYHKQLFEHQRELSADNLKKWAADLKLDSEKFDACLASNKYEATIKKSVEAGQKLGISGTPGFFVNGIPIKGAQPFEVFQKTIDEELARAK
jgi:predicted DsbA family dithiol-disulfide isomerase